MARNTDENNEGNINPASVASNVKNTFKQVSFEFALLTITLLLSSVSVFCIKLNKCIYFT